MKGRNGMATARMARLTGLCWGIELASATTIEALNRRDFLFLIAGAVIALGVAAVASPPFEQMNPEVSTHKLASTEIDFCAILEGQIVTVKRPGGPVFIRRLTKTRIEDAESAPLMELSDSQKYVVLTGGKVKIG